MRSHGRIASGKCLFESDLSASVTKGVCTIRETLVEMLCDGGETETSKMSHLSCCRFDSRLANVAYYFKTRVFQYSPLEW